MKKYFIKAPISGWHEVTKGAYEEHCERVRKGSPAIPEHRKASFIATRAKEVELGEYYYTAKKRINRLLYDGEEEYIPTYLLNLVFDGKITFEEAFYLIQISCLEVF